MKKVIEQIKELKGVKTVESMSDKVVVTFEVDLVEGEIYYSETDNFKYIFRIKEGQYYYSMLNSIKEFRLNDFMELTTDIIPATDKQKRKLIRHEVKNGYFHELNK